MKCKGRTWLRERERQREGAEGLRAVTAQAQLTLNVSTVVSGCELASLEAAEVSVVSNSASCGASENVFANLQSQVCHARSF